MAKKNDDGGMPVKLKVKLSARSDESGSGQVTRQLREMIESGRLKPGDAMPSEEGLAEELGIGRKIVRYAYGKLIDEGAARPKPPAQQASGCSEAAITGEVRRL